MATKTKFQLIVQGEQGEHIRGDSQVVDLEGDTPEEAMAHARRLLVGDKDQWVGTLTKDWRRVQGIEVRLSDDGVEPLTPGAEYVFSAQIVEVHESVDLDALRGEVSQWSNEEMARLETERDKAELERLRRKLEVSPRHDR